MLLYNNMKIVFRYKYERYIRKSPEDADLIPWLAILQKGMV